MIKYAIWDLDGTLLDDIDLWMALPTEYLQKQGVKDIPADIADILNDMSLEESADYFRDKFNIKYSQEEIVEQFMSLMRFKYREEIAFFEDRKKIVKKLYKDKVRMCILTTTEYGCAYDALKRGGILECFEKIFTCGELGMTKRTEDIYIKVCEMMNFVVEDTVIYEDSDFAVESAMKSGCKVIDCSLFI